MTALDIDDFVKLYRATADGRNKLSNHQIKSFYRACQRMSGRKAAASCGLNVNTALNLRNRMRLFGLNFPSSKKPDWAYGDKEYVAAPITLGGPEWSWPQYVAEARHV